MSYSILSFSDLFQLAKCLPNPSMLLHMAKFCSFLWLSSIPLCVCVCVCVYHIFLIHSSVNGLKLLPYLAYYKKLLLWTLRYMYLFELVFLFSLDTYPGMVEKKMATHSSILAWSIPWTERAGGPQSIGSQRIRHDWSDLACMHPGMELLNHTVVLFLVFWATSILFSTVAILIF